MDALERHRRSYTVVNGKDVPQKFILIPQGAVANASAKISDYFDEFSGSLEEEQRRMLGVRKVELPYSTVYQFGANTVTENQTFYREDASLVIDANTEYSLERLLTISELKRFEPRKKPKKRK